MTKGKKGMTPQKALEVYATGKKSKLKKHRVKKGLSQQELADVSGIKKRAILSYEQGERDIDLAKLETLCDLCISLDIKIEDILESEELKEKYRKSK